MVYVTYGYIWYILQVVYPKGNKYVTGINTYSRYYSYLVYRGLFLTDLC